MRARLASRAWAIREALDDSGGMDAEKEREMQGRDGKEGGGGVEGGRVRRRKRFGAKMHATSALARRIMSSGWKAWRDQMSANVSPQGGGGQEGHGGACVAGGAGLELGPGLQWLQTEKRGADGKQHAALKACKSAEPTPLLAAAAATYRQANRCRAEETCSVSHASLATRHHDDADVRATARDCKKSTEVYCTRAAAKAC
jgi:hypothetical protein